jgi:rhodanese-related sulfurtransferase
MRPDSAPELSASEAAQLLAATPATPVDAAPVILLDVREPEEWDAGHAPQARSLPMSQLSERIAELPHDTQIICVCHLGGRSAAVSAALNRAGFDAVNLSGGMAAWQAAGLPVVTDSGAPGDVI